MRLTRFRRDSDGILLLFPHFQGIITCSAKMNRSYLVNHVIMSSSTRQKQAPRTAFAMRGAFHGIWNYLA